MTAIRVLHVIQSLTRGGAARAMLAIATSGANGVGADGVGTDTVGAHGVAVRGVRTDTVGAHGRAPLRSDPQQRILSILPAEPAARQMAEAAGIGLLDAPTAAETREAIAESDIVHVHFWNNPELYAWLCAEWPPMRLLLWSLVSGVHAPQVITPELLDLPDLFVMSSLVSVELPVVQALPAGERAARTALVPAGADMRRVAGAQPQPHDGFAIGYLGSVDFAKLHPRYVALSAQAAIPDVRFIVYGSGDAFKTLGRQARALGVASRFEMRGYVEDIRSVLERLDVFGYPLCVENTSTSELVLQEAMACGVPPVVLPYGGAQRVVRHQQTGLIAQTEDEYPRALEYLYQHPAERLRMGNAARDYALRNFGAHYTAAAFAELYARMMAEPPRLHRLDWPLEASGGTGAERFIRSLGEQAAVFRASMSARNDDEARAAERMIAQSPPVLISGGGGIPHYRFAYPRDPYLRLWMGLVLQQQGRLALAAGEFAQAIRLGCDHARVNGYLSLCITHAETR